jgi:hypothetical protein
VNQTLQAEIASVMPTANTLGLFVSLCTIQQPAGSFDGAGYPVGTWTTVSGLASIPCMITPVTSRLQAMELKAIAETLAVSPRHVLLQGLYPNILTAWRAVVDGEALDILGVDHDSQSVQTRLEVRSASE